MTRLLHAALLLLFLLLSAPTVRSQVADIQLSNEGLKAYDTLLVAQSFESEFIGYGGAPSKLVAAYNVILNEPAADWAFKTLLGRATLPGKLYSLCGLFLTDNLFFRKAIEPYRNNREKVDTLFGCLGGPMRVSELVEAKNPIIVDIKHPNDSLQAYFEMDRKLHEEWDHRKQKKKNDRRPPGHDLDILHGGYPVFYRTKTSAFKSQHVEQFVGRERNQRVC